MALVTIQRSPSPSADQDLDQTDSSEDINDGKSQMKRRSRSSKEKLRKVLSSMRFISKLRPCLSQSYFTVKGAALILPHTEFTKKSAKKSHGGEIQNHLQAMLHLLRPDDTIQIAIRLEDINQYQRYIALVSSKGRQDTEEAVILGIDCNNTEASIGLVLPVWMGLKITLGGDGGFSVCTDEQCYIFNPVSVQAMWSAIQSLVKFQRTADEMKYIPDGLTHTWVGYYKSIVSPRDSAPINQWNVEGVEVFAPSSLSIKPNDADEKIKQTISSTLKEVMMTVDLDEATSIMLRRAVEEKMSISLADFKSYFDEEMMRILGQMDKPSEILDFLYLGSEWNASNLEELLANGIGYILNVTKEIDNFFEGRFHYYSVRVTDEETSDLLTSWEKTFRFISKARSQKSKVLVHCKMGVSRSASTVMAFLMKDRRWSVEEAFSFVKERRSCVHPNSGFMDQLSMYEAILIASNKRDIFRHKSEQNLLEENAKDEADNTEGSFLGDSLFRMMSHSDWQSAGGGVAHEEEWIDSSQKDETHDADAKTDKDLETGSCSAESTEDVFPDLSSPSAETTITAGNLTSLMTPSSLPSTWSSLKATSLDFEIAQESRSISRTPPARAVCLSESSGLTHLQASASAQSSRIKPDSSWIRLDSIDTELDQTDSHDTVPSCESYDSAQPNLSASDTAVTETKETLIPSQEILENISNIKEDSTSIPAATTVPEPLPYFPASGFETNSVSSDKIFSDRIQTSAHFYIGDTHTSLNIIPAVPSTGIFPSGVALKQSGSFSSISSYNPAEKTSSIPIPVSCDHTVPQILQDSSRKQEPVAWQTSPSKFNNEAVDTVGYDGQIMKTREDAAGVGADTSDSSSILAGSPQDKIQFDGYQQFLGEQTAFKLGKIAKIPEDISKSDQVSHKTNEDNKSRKAAEVIQISLVVHNESEVSDDNLLLNKIPDHLSATTMFHSHSCMELCTQGEGDVTITPLYEREKIQVTPGTVLRTKFEIEERQRFLWW
uniref:protein-serine/threonine phosphatase n=2 Tax=Arion vulgaris TaxID=1028688 RepID=A0A0B7AVJ1_9EUPU